ncbi:MAG: molybdopterin molybdotransferase MoeA [Bacteroidetes bacterium]|nr:molybdopterin molybdotransferase MoeA [Bacteroidota bacterium]
MISVQKAQEAVIEAMNLGNEINLPVAESLGYVVAQVVYSPLALPPFRQSGVDGYAFRFEDYKNGEEIQVIGESSAGKSFLRQIEHNQAVRIFTGAEVPDGADTVVMQEKVTREGKALFINDQAITFAANVRPKGSHINSGDVALTRGSVITAGTIGFLASMGIREISVFSKPRVAIIITGNELRQAGEQLESGQIYESNAVCLQAALQAMRIKPTEILFAPDDEESIRSAFRRATTQADCVLITGGISVGDYDFVGKILREEQVSEIFYKVKQRPGKPLFVGKFGNVSVFALPGNPASVLTCFYEYALPALRTVMGYPSPFLQSLQLPLNRTITTIKGLTFFLKAATDFQTVTSLDGQPSYIMRSFSEANCFIVVPEDTVQIEAGEIVEVHLLPN